jgi:hypothetical protein
MESPGVRQVDVANPSLKLDSEEAMKEFCDFVASDGNEFVVFQKTDGGFLAVPANVIRSVETG